MIYLTDGQYILKIQFCHNYMSLTSIESKLEDLKVLSQRSLNLLHPMYIYYISQKPNQRNLFQQLSLQLKDLINSGLQPMSGYYFFAPFQGENIIWIFSNIRMSTFWKNMMGCHNRYLLPKIEWTKGERGEGYSHMKMNSGYFQIQK